MRLAVSLAPGRAEVQNSAVLRERQQLPHVDQTYELDDADKKCTACGGELTPMAGQFEESELVDVVEVSYRVVKVKQQKYVCRCGACVETPYSTTPARQ